MRRVIYKVSDVVVDFTPVIFVSDSVDRSIDSGTTCRSESYAGQNFMQQATIIWNRKNLFFFNYVLDPPILREPSPFYYLVGPP